MSIHKFRSGHASYPGHIVTMDTHDPPSSGSNEAYSNTGGASHIGHWIYQVGRFERFEETSLYLNGIKQDDTDSCEINNIAGGSNFIARIGRHVASTEWHPNSMKGYLDEVRISKGVARSGAWISTSYNNINDTKTFITFGEVEFGIPIADFTYLIHGLSVFFNASLSYDLNGEIVSYGWDFGDGTNGTGMITTHDYPDIGMYDVTLIVTDDDDFESDITKSIVLTNQPPDAPIINGPNSGKPRRIYSYTFVSEDPNGDNVSYEINWGEGSVEPWDGPHGSNVVISRDHSWDEKGTFTIMARAKDSYGLIGEWGTLDITMPKNKPFIFNFPLLNWLFEHIINVLPLLRFLID